MRIDKRAERQADTRRRLLDAAAAVFADRGYHAASLEEIAAAAGYTTGAVYSNFAGKAELFLALLERTTMSHVQLYDRLLEEPAPPGGSGAQAAAFMDFIEREPRAWTLFMEFWVHAVRDPAMRKRLAEGHGALRKAIARMLEDGSQSAPSGDEALWLATVVQALGSGLALIKLLDPRDVPDDMFGRALELLYRGWAA